MVGQNIEELKGKKITLSGRGFQGSGISTKIFIIIVVMGINVLALYEVLRNRYLNRLKEEEERREVQRIEEEEEAVDHQSQS